METDYIIVDTKLINSLNSKGVTNGKQIMLYAKLLSMSSTKGYCSPSNPYLAEKLCTTERNISKYIADLETKEIISTEYKRSGHKTVSRKIIPLLVQNFISSVDKNSLKRIQNQDSSDKTASSEILHEHLFMNKCSRTPDSQNQDSSDKTLRNRKVHEQSFMNKCSRTLIQDENRNKYQNEDSSDDSLANEILHEHLFMNKCSRTPGSKNQDSSDKTLADEILLEQSFVNLFSRQPEKRGVQNQDSSDDSLANRKVHEQSFMNKCSNQYYISPVDFAEGDDSTEREVEEEITNNIDNINLLTPLINWSKDKIKEYTPYRINKAKEYILNNDKRDINYYLCLDIINYPEMNEAMRLPLAESYANGKLHYRIKTS